MDRYLGAFVGSVRRVPRGVQGLAGSVCQLAAWGILGQPSLPGDARWCLANTGCHWRFGNLCLTGIRNQESGIRGEESGARGSVQESPNLESRWQATSSWGYSLFEGQRSIQEQFVAAADDLSQQVAICRIRLRRWDGGRFRRKLREDAKFGNVRKNTVLICRTKVRFVAAKRNSSHLG
jgi:hypothetical protein